MPIADPPQRHTYYIGDPPSTWTSGAATITWPTPRKITLEEALAEAKAEVKRIEQQIEDAKYPEEPIKGTVIRFERDGSNRRKYDYAAIRARDGRWYTTGSTCPIGGWSWRALIDWLRAAGEVDVRALIEDTED